SVSSFRSLSVLFLAVSFALLRSCILYVISTPPSSTLFPYTTLFRSLRAPGARRPTRRESAPARGRRRRSRSLRRLLRTLRGARRDRKSTRLNSSHVESSYAVFCLKKKRRNLGSKVSTMSLLPPSMGV